MGGGGSRDGGPGRRCRQNMDRGARAQGAHSSRRTRHEPDAGEPMSAPLGRSSDQDRRSTGQMVEAPRVRNDPLPKREDRGRCKRKTLGQGGLRWRRQGTRDVMSDAERATHGRLAVLLVRIAAYRNAVVAADAELMGGRGGGGRNARNEDAGQDDVEHEGIDRNECSPPSDPSPAREPRHSTQPL